MRINCYIRVMWWHHCLRVDRTPWSCGVINEWWDQMTWCNRSIKYLFIILISVNLKEDEMNMTKFSKKDTVETYYERKNKPSGWSHLAKILFDSRCIMCKIFDLQTPNDPYFLDLKMYLSIFNPFNLDRPRWPKLSNETICTSINKIWTNQQNIHNQFG